MTKRTRLIDIANKVGVSIGSVSAVLSPNLAGNMKVGPELTARILATAKEMHYVPNSAARILAGRPSGLIGVLMDTHAPTVCSQLLAEIEKALASHGLRVLTGMSHNNVDKMFETYQALIQHGVDGVICLSYDYPGERERITEYFKDEKKILFVNGSTIKGHCCVQLDFVKAVGEAVKYLYDHGRKNLGFVCTKGNVEMDKGRINGFLIATEGKGKLCFVDHLIHEPKILHESLKNFVDDYVRKEQLDAIITLDDMTALTCISYLRKAGLSVPEDVAVVGFDNEVFSSLLEPPLATIDGDLAKQAEESVALLFKIMKEPNSEPETRVITPIFIPRKSAGI